MNGGTRRVPAAIHWTGGGGGHLQQFATNGQGTIPRRGIGKLLKRPQVGRRGIRVGQTKKKFAQRGIKNKGGGQRQRPCSSVLQEGSGTRQTTRFRNHSCKESGIKMWKKKKPGSRRTNEYRNHSKKTTHTNKSQSCNKEALVWPASRDNGN